MASESVANGAIANGKSSKKRKHQGEQNEVAEGESKKPSKEERREAKRLKKLAKEDALPTENNGEAAVVKDVTNIYDKVAKRKRKEEKKRRKEEKAIQSQKVVESEVSGVPATNGDASEAGSDGKGAMNEDRMQMIEKAEARDQGSVEGKKIARTEKNARNKEKKKAKKAERIQGPEKGAVSDSKADITPASKVKKPSNQQDFVSIHPSEKDGEGEDTFTEATHSVRQERKQREKEERSAARKAARRAAREAESTKELEETIEPAKVVTDEKMSEERRQRKEEARKVAQKLKPNAISADFNASAETNMNGEMKREREQRKQEAILEIEKLERRKPKVKEPQREANGKLPDLPQVDTGVQPSDPAAGYVEDSVLQALPQATIDDFLMSNNIAIRDLATDKAPSQRPIIDFKYLPTIPGLSSASSPFATFKAPTPIQAAAWPHLLSSRDVIGVAETGSGKTLAFGVPCIQHITSLPKSLPGESPARAVIVSPTRELASQIHTQIDALAQPAGLHAVCLYGGIPKNQQRADLKRAHIIIATPGRLNDLIEEGHADLSRVTYLVLDEADRMLDKGFEEAISTIISRTPPTGRQTAMFTATWPASVRELAATFMFNPIRITISSSSNGGDNTTGELRANPNITQQVEVMDPHWKEGRLRELIKALSPPSENTSRKQSSMVNKQYPIKMQQNRVLIFCLYKKEADRIERMLRKAMAGSEIRIAAIHGDMSQPLRTASLSAFKKGEVSVLVATDVAARGLDIPDVKAVINFTFPLTVEDYVHRIGRTGRAGKEGLAVTFFTELDKGLAGGLINVLKAAGQEVPEDLLKFGTTVKKKAHEAYGNFYREVREGEKKEGTMTRLS